MNFALPLRINGINSSLKTFSRHENPRMHKNMSSSCFTKKMLHIPQWYWLVLVQKVETLQVCMEPQQLFILPYKDEVERTSDIIASYRTTE